MRVLAWIAPGTWEAVVEAARHRPAGDEITLLAVADAAGSDVAAALRARGVSDVDDSALTRSLYAADASLYRVVPQVVARPRHVDEIDGISAGGMPSRVKCLHVLVAHSLSVGEGVNPLGDEALEMLPDWWASHPCTELAEGP